ncbi:MAG TPA: protein kinase [Kofleriaceae bacterium]|nr:protein kinase [Kofleriaceae bacterium]
MDRSASIRLGSYQVRDRLGEGGGGQVYRGDGPDGPVAIKVLAPGADLDDAARARFRREATALAALRHPGLITLVDHGVDDELGPYLVLPLVAGATLRARCGGRRLCPEAAAVLAQPIAAAVAALHAAGFVHRDLKPDNVMAGADGRITVIDLGLAWREGMTRHTETGVAVGTVGYMAPEQIEGGRVGPAADVWALGVLVFEWIAGERPFARARPGEEAIATLVGAAPALGAVDRRVDDRLAALVARCLALDPAARPTAGAVADELAAWLADAQIDAGDATRAAVLADPDGYQARIAAGRARTFADGARAAIAGGRPFAALALCDRALAYAPDAPEVAALVASIEASAEASAPTAAAPAPAPAAVPGRGRLGWIAGGAAALVGLALVARLVPGAPGAEAPPPAPAPAAAPAAPASGASNAEGLAVAREMIDLFGIVVERGAAAGPSDGPRPATATGWLTLARSQPPREAVASVRQALALQPTWGAAQLELCRLLVDLADPGAGAACDAAVRLRPDDPAARGLRAIELGRAGEHARAIAELTKVIAVDGDVRWRVARGRLHARAGDHAAAATDLARACQLGEASACAAATERR